MERELKNIGNVKEIRSSSREGLSNISIEFEPDTDIDGALQKVRDKVDQAKPKLPADAEEPVISEINFSNIPIMIINISGNYSLRRLKEVGEDLRDRIETIPGVLDVTLTGGLDREVKVKVDPDRLRYYNLSLNDVMDVIRNENLSTPGGVVDLGAYGYTVRVPGEFDTPAIIGDLVVEAKDGMVVYIRDVADVEYGYKEPGSYARLNSVKCVNLSVTKRSGENLVRISDEIKALLGEVEGNFPPGTNISITADASRDVRKMVDDLENNIISGLILVVTVLFAFLGFRTALFVALAIPFSMLISFFFIEVFGFTLNMVVLFSLILSLGMLVDNAVVIVENIYRHGEEGLDPVEAARQGTREVATPVTVATITTLCAFFPIIFWPGTLGEFMKYLPKTLMITLSASLFVALVINPVLCAVLLKVRSRGGSIDGRDDISPLVRMYRQVLRLALKHPVGTLSSSIVALAAVFMVYLFSGLGVEFFPRTDPSKVFIDIETPPGTNLDETNEVTAKVEAVVRRYRDISHYVSSVGVSTGRFDVGGETGPANKARIAVDFLDMEERSQSSEVTTEEMRNGISRIVGAEIRVRKERHGPPTGPPVNIEISGDDYALLGRLAARARHMIKDVPGLVDLRDDYETGRPEIRVRIDRTRAALYDLSTRKIADTIRTAVNGTMVSTYREYEDEYDITVRFKKGSRDSIEDIRDMTIAHEGRQIPLANIATIELAGGPGTVMRKDLRRVVTVSADVEGRLKSEVLRDVQEILGGLELPPGYRMEYTGEREEQVKAEGFLKRAFTMALLLIAFVLVLEFNSILTSFVVMFSVFLSLVGVFIGLMVTGMPFGIIMTGIGVISLAGVVVNNAIVLLDYTIRLRNRGFERTEALVVAGMTRLRPVLLTAVTTILGLIPMATGYYFDFKRLTWITGSESAQWWGPMAVAVIFGLAFATVLTLVVVPVLYSVLDGVKERVPYFAGVKGKDM